jgi:hypothetical protein
MMNTFIAVTVSILAILWINAGIRSIREMNDVDNDAAEWATMPFMLKIVFILFAPLLMPFYERGILNTRKK